MTPSTPGSSSDGGRSRRLRVRFLLWLVLVVAVVALYQCPPRQYAIPEAGVSFVLPWTLDAWRPWGPPLPGELREEGQGVILRASPVGSLAGIRLRTFEPAPGQSLPEYAAALEETRRRSVGYCRLFHRSTTRYHYRYDLTFAQYPGMRYLKEIELPLAGRFAVRHYQYDTYFEAGEVFYQATYAVPVVLSTYYEVYYRWIMRSIRLEGEAGP